MQRGHRDYECGLYCYRAFQFFSKGTEDQHIIKPWFLNLSNFVRRDMFRTKNYRDQMIVGFQSGRFKGLSILRYHKDLSPCSMFSQTPGA